MKIHKIILFILIMSLFPLNNLKGQQIENIHDSLIDIFYSTTKKAFKRNVKEKQPLYLIFEYKFNDTIDVKLNSEILFSNLLIQTKPNLGVCDTFLLIPLVDSVNKIKIIFNKTRKIELQAKFGYSNIYISRWKPSNKNYKIWSFNFSNVGRSYY